MGYSSYDDGARQTYSHREADRTAGRVQRMAYTAAINAGTENAQVHRLMNPFGVNMREARDSAQHPETKAVAVFVDITGSMRTAPGIIQQRLHRLMSLLVDRNYIEHPAIFIGAVGDANSDHAPLQIAQFESGIEVDDWIDRIWGEGNGGGQGKETYEIAHYWAARHTSLDCWERRQQKGYLFTIGDEGFYPQVDKYLVKQVIGDDLEVNIPTRQIIEELQERWHVYHIALRTRTLNDSILGDWRRLLGDDHVIEMQSPENASELLGTAIGIVEGRVTLDEAMANLQQLGSDAAALASIRRSLEEVANRSVRVRPEPTTA